MQKGENSLRRAETANIKLWMRQVKLNIKIPSSDLQEVDEDGVLPLRPNANDYNHIHQSLSTTLTQRFPTHKRQTLNEADESWFVVNIRSRCSNSDIVPIQCKWWASKKPLQQCSITKPSKNESRYIYLTQTKQFCFLVIVHREASFQERSHWLLFSN